MTLRSRAAGGRRTVRRVIKAVARRAGLSSSHEVEALHSEVAELREQLRRTREARQRTRRKLQRTREVLQQTRLASKKNRSEVKRLRAEILATRASLRDPFPEAVLSEQVMRTIDRVRKESLTYLSKPNLAVLAGVAAEAERSSRPGLIIEAGTARGGSAIVLAAAKSPERPMKVYDVFGMIPEPTSADGPDVQRRYELIKGGEAYGAGGQTYYGYRDDLVREVAESFARHGVPLAENKVDLVQGLFQDTIDLDEPVAFAHLDGDWYESTKVCLERLAPLLVPGGRLVLDDYNAWSGCRVAVDEYFSGRSGFRFERRARLHVIKLGH